MCNLYFFIRPHFKIAITIAQQIHFKNLISRANLKLNTLSVFPLM